MSERNKEAYALAEKVSADSIVVQALERFVYQIVETCSEHEKDALAAQAVEIARLKEALHEGRRFMDYFANGRREFAGPGTPLSCLAHIDWALNPNVPPCAPALKGEEGK